MIQLEEMVLNTHYPKGFDLNVDLRLFQSLEVMDRNRDGKLMMEEVEQCLIPGTYRYREFHKALKLSTPEGFKVRRGWLGGDVGGDGRGKKGRWCHCIGSYELYVCTTSNTDDWQSTVNQMIYKSSCDSVSTAFS